MPMKQRFEVGDLILHESWRRPRKVTDVRNNAEDQRRNYFCIANSGTYYYRDYEDQEWTNTSIVKEPEGMSKCKFIVVKDGGRALEGQQFDKQQDAIDYASKETQRLRKNHMVFSLTNIVKVKETPVIVETVSCG